MPKYQRLSPESAARMTEEEHRARQRRMQAAAQRRWRAKLTPEEKKQRQQADDARCYDWARIEPHVDKREDGCWIWTGSFSIAFANRPYPRVRAGSRGTQHAAYVVWSLTHKKPVPHGCFLVRSCGNIACVAPEHALVSNQPVERAKRRIHEQEKLAGRHEQGNGRRGSGEQPAQRSRRAAAG